VKVLVTGAGGFVGAHTALALLAGGHSLRLLVRDPEGPRRYFAERGHPLDDVQVVNLRNQEAVTQAMRGCDAVFHAAAAVSLDPNKAQETYANNIGCMQAVLNAAGTLGIKRIVYVSSLSVLFHPGLPSINEDTPLADCKDAYSRSKRDADEQVRELQLQGLPVQISYPSAVVGPDDPKLSEANRGLIKFVSQFLPLTTTGFQCVDVRDLGLAHCHLLENPPAGSIGLARYILGGRYYPWPRFRQNLEAAAGRRIFAMATPAPLLRGFGRLVDAINRLAPFETQISAEAMAYVTQWSPADSGRFLNRADAGFQFRPGVETFADTLRWMGRAGHIAPRWAAVPA
jgi:nucleoside-diphosphate-sugar epimerase